MEHEMSEILNKAIEELRGAPTVNIKGKQYTQVAARVEIFRKHFAPPEWGIITEIHSIEDQYVRVTAAITHNGIAVATGLAEENRTQGPINKTSAMENAETSAIGRAMASFGLHGGEYASAGEVSNAIASQRGGVRGAAITAEKPLGITKIKADMKEFASRLGGCATPDQLTSLLDEYKQALEECKNTIPAWWNGNPEQPDVPGFFARIEAAKQAVGYNLGAG